MESTETIVAAVSACAAVLALVLALYVARTIRARSDRRLKAVLGRLDLHLSGISATLERVVQRAGGLRAVDDLELTVDFDELLRRLAAEVAMCTGADAAAAQVRGPAGELRSAEFGDVSSVHSLDAPLARPSGPFRAVTINWSYRPGAASAQDPVTSALVVPILENGSETGALAAYAPESWVFGPEHVHALEALAAEAAPALTAARGFAEAQRELTDALTGVRNRAGYDVELDRAVKRASETGKPLSLLILSRDGSGETSDTALDSTDELMARDVAALLVSATRATDVVCRRREREFGIVLRDTAGDTARRFYGRLREAASQSSSRWDRQQTFASGLVEWKRNETSEELDARTLAAVGHTHTEPLELPAAQSEPGAASVTPSFRSDFEKQLVREVGRAKQLERPLALLVARVDGIEQIEIEYGATAADRVLDEVKSRLRGALDHEDAAARLAGNVLGVILSGSETRGAESVFAALQASLGSDPSTHLARLAISAGITELAASDDAAVLLERAEHALERAVRTGPGTVVVALAADEE
ncbi:MAG: diguanylate cyclase [Actinobacteria bacterium]|nr:diguanylate cyclase [Actinomycetota bacterium]